MLQPNWPLLSSVWLNASAGTARGGICLISESVMFVCHEQTPRDQARVSERRGGGQGRNGFFRLGRDGDGGGRDPVNGKVSETMFRLMRQANASMRREVRGKARRA